MTDQTVNYARPGVGAPLLLGTVGAVAGATLAPVKKGYKTVEELLTVAPDKFEKIANEAAKLTEGEAKNCFAKLVEGREFVKNFKLSGVITDSPNPKSLAEYSQIEAVKKLTGEGGALKDFNVKNIKEILPKAKLGWGIGLALLGLFIGRIISVAKANKKNMAIAQAQAMQAQNA